MVESLKPDIAKAAGWHFGDFFLRMSPVAGVGTGMWTVNLYAGRKCAGLAIWRNVARKVRGDAAAIIRRSSRKKRTRRG